MVVVPKKKLALDKDIGKIHQSEFNRQLKEISLSSEKSTSLVEPRWKHALKSSRSRVGRKVAAASAAVDGRQRVTGLQRWRKMNSQLLVMGPVVRSADESVTAAHQEMGSTLGEIQKEGFTKPRTHGFGSMSLRNLLFA